MHSDPRFKCKLTSEEMVALRREGKTFKEIGEVAGVTPTWVAYKVHALLPDHEDPRHVRKYNQKMFVISGKIRAGVRRALEDIAGKRGETFSEFIAAAVEDRIITLGGIIPAETPEYTGEPLPFQEEAQR